jgi:hypothetical protein
MNGIRCAYCGRREAEHAERRRDGVAAASMASFTMCSGSKYAGIRPQRRAGECSNALVDQAGATLAGPGQPAGVEQR